MYEEPEELPTEDVSDPKRRAEEKAEELRMYAEIAAVFEGPRKFDAELKPRLDANLAKDLQRSILRLAKAREGESPLIPPESGEEAGRVLQMPQTAGLSTNDYHIHRRPGEVLIVRWLEGEQVDSFYERLQAHFDAGRAGFIDEQRSQSWKQDDNAEAFLDALEAIDGSLANRYFRDAVKQHGFYLMSTQTADEMNIAYLSDYVMGLTPAELVGPANAPADDATEHDLAWFYKLFSLRGVHEGTEQMCFFVYLQKTDDSFGE